MGPQRPKMEGEGGGLEPAEYRWKIGGKTRFFEPWHHPGREASHSASVSGRTLGGRVRNPKELSEAG